MRIAAAPIGLETAQRPDAARIDAAAREFEGVFAQMLVKSMRDASFGDALFPGESTLYRDLYDQRLAKSLTEGRGLGLAATIARQLGGAAKAAPALDTALGPDRPGDAAQVPDARLLDLIAGRPPSADDPAAEPARSPLDGLVDRLLARAQPVVEAAAGAVAAVPAALESAARAAAEGFAPRSPERFVASIWSHAQAAARELGVDARALVAQAALETGWGRRTIQRSDGDTAHNLFGIKATGWQGERAAATTHEYVDGARRTERAEFRAYASPAESFADYVRLLKQNPRYRQALESGGDVRRFAGALQRAGYATDPRYADKISAIAQGPTLERALSAIARVADGAGDALHTGREAVRTAGAAARALIR
ncbi:flagellar assembly peptidoglycan hydrolase FlgJ [Luteimonas sp. Y-2-2-4F]|nr:flagellar assembly peptidoglycan hydrolase FlgJ [Luteimonas sp. Y-2-2-4F]MCD9030423.1 flagellar assembly peptidoglycan hydrolase FlgJ [Luteimonas sp. Y-2-2-4F]